MITLTAAQTRRALFILVLFHIVVIAASNYLVQLEFQLFGLNTTWGTFSFPFVYLATDLTVRIFGAQRARKIIFRALLPALLVSYLVSALFYEGRLQGLSELATLNIVVLRIAIASFIAYVCGQLLDIGVFSYLRRQQRWWVAPAASSVLGNMLDTLIFYAAAFAGSTDEFMAANWPEIAVVDYLFKIIVTIALFLPAYGVLLSFLTSRIVHGAK
ncbi:MAG: 7-cyano-7-deazaguanine/7-aminomethyl-7-deazaguanine transporter [Desulfocapsaceae bacterium]